jgi:hypothetical protein
VAAAARGLTTERYYNGRQFQGAVGVRDDEQGCNDACPGDMRQICGDGGNSKYSSPIFGSRAFRVATSTPWPPIIFPEGWPGAGKHSSVYRLFAPPPPNQCAGLNPRPAIMFGQQSGNTGLGVSGGFSGSMVSFKRPSFCTSISIGKNVLNILSSGWHPTLPLPTGPRGDRVSVPLRRESVRCVSPGAGAA